MAGEGSTIIRRNGRPERSSVDSLPPQPTLDLVLGARQLRADGFAAIVVHRESYPPRKATLVVQQLSALLGEGTAAGTATVFFL